jgi:UDP-glucose 4-epimerase
VNAFVTGAAGFIGSNLVDRLLAAGHQVTGFDNLSTGFRSFLAGALANPRFRLVEGDLLDPAAIAPAMAGADFVFHLAANRDLPSRPEHPRRDLEQNTIVTWNVLEAMRATGARRIAFSSTAGVYGEPLIVPTPEDAPFPTQTSLHGAAKVAAEGMIDAYVTAFGFQATIFRFGSILGERCTHGPVFDFYRQLREHPEWLDVPGDGRRRESYLHVQDLIDAVLLAVERCTEALHVFNLGTEEDCQGNDSIGWIAGPLGLQPELRYAGAEGGPFALLDCARMRGLGWNPRLSILEGVIRTLQFLRENPWLLEARK